MNKELILTTKLANHLINHVINNSNIVGVAVSVAIVDSGGNLKAFIRMDDAWIGSIDIAIKKAKTAAYFNMPTHELGKLSQPHCPLYGIEYSNGGLITFPGGLPLVEICGKNIGAVGVSGSTVDNDLIIAQAAPEELLSNDC